MMVQVPASDNPGVIMHPPLLYLSGVVIGAVVNWMKPLPVSHSSFVRIIGLVVVILGIIWTNWGRLAMKAHGTNINPTKPTTTIVRSGPYRLSRNPLYLGLTIVYLGLSLAVNSWWCLLLLIPISLLMHFQVVLREERYLDRKFGETYREYQRRVRRYL
jgi:protein-S-isoprenylcysteine O-methyltransferase Ste14